MKISSPFASFAVSAILFSLAPIARAQDAPEENLPENIPPNTQQNGGQQNGGLQNGGVPAAQVAGAARMVQVEDESLANLPALLLRGGGPAAISLGASEEALDANPAARAALLGWVRGGGTVFLHTGAARAFGFVTVSARLGNNQQAGQLFGRARAALPFGAHPLLWDDGKTGRTARGADPTQLPGVGVVFYQLREGDDLVVSHPAGTALLEVSDLAGAAPNSLYAVAMAPFGRGFAVFTPDFIDQTRGDGALFTRNLLNLLSPSGRAQNSALAGAKLVGIDASAIENAAVAPAALQNALFQAANFQNAPPALPAFGTGATLPNLNGNVPPAQVNANQNLPENADNMALDAGAAAGVGIGAGAAGAEEELGETQVILSRAEASSYAKILALGDARAAVVVNLLRARLFLLRGDEIGASRAVEASAGFAPEIAEVALWRGILLAGAAQEINQPSPARAQILNQAAQNFVRATGAPSIAAGIANFNAPNPNAGPPMVPGAMNGAVQDGTVRNAGNAMGVATLAGIPVTVVRGWSVKMGQIAQVFALEPPQVQQYGVGSSTITVRAVAEDPALPLIVVGAQALATARDFGWHGDRQEIVLFPTPQLYAQYRAAVGLTGPSVPLPAGAVGDVVGQRILMLALPSAPALGRSPITGQVTLLGTNNSAADVLARLHSYVLLRAYDENARSPVWLQLGLENLAKIAISGNTQVVTDNQILAQVAQAGGLLTPEQFGDGFGDNRPNQIMIAQAQAASLMAYFYRVHGAGAVTETVQRFGAGQSADEALQATTEADELSLFQNWRQAQFRPRNFPNAG